MKATAATSAIWRFGLSLILSFALSHAKAQSVDALGASSSQLETNDAEVELPEADRYQTIVARPLFDPSRRPPQAVEPLATPSDVTTKVMPPPQATLRGIVSAGRVGRKAIVLEAGAQRSRRLGVGDELAGWRVKKIHARSVTLEHANETLTLDMIRKDIPAPIATNVVDNSPGEPATSDVAPTGSTVISEPSPPASSQ